MSASTALGYSTNWACDEIILTGCPSDMDSTAPDRQQPPKAQLISEAYVSVLSQAYQREAFWLTTNLRDSYFASAAPLEGS